MFEIDDVIRSFRIQPSAPIAGSIVNFLGVRTRVAYSSAFAAYDGVVEGYPLPGNFHATALEWAGGLRAVLDAKTEFNAVELGAGWGPWLVSLSRAAHLRGIGRIRLVGVEGSAPHFRYMLEHFLDNGIDPSTHTLVHGIAGVRDGIAEFPVLADPTKNWGARGIFSERAGLTGRLLDGPLGPIVRAVKRLTIARGPSSAQATERVHSYSLTTLLDPFTSVDLVHVDIQGDEHLVLSQSRTVLKQKVKRLVIGTHGRSIEEKLLNDLAADAWILEGEEPCRFRQERSAMLLDRDGCQIWRNPAVA